MPDPAAPASFVAHNLHYRVGRRVLGWLPLGRCVTAVWCRGTCRVWRRVQSKRGWLWSRSALAADQWTITLRFRVSGQGKRLFGDGFALWVTQHRYHADGPIHGFVDKFTGRVFGWGRRLFFD